MLSFLTDSYHAWQDSDTVLKVLVAFIAILALLMVTILTCLLVGGIIVLIDKVGRPVIEAKARVIGKQHEPGYAYMVGSVATRAPDSFIVFFDVEGFGTTDGKFSAEFWDVANEGCRATVSLVIGRLTGSRYVERAELA